MKNALSAAGRTINRHRKAAVAAVLAVAVGVAIVTVNPWSISSYSLNSAGVWVQSGGMGLAHRVDTSVHAFDASVDELPSAVVVQDGQEVLLADSAQLTPLNGATVVNGRPTPLGTAYPNVKPSSDPSLTGVVLGGGVLAIRGEDNHGTTEVWVGSFNGSTIALPPHPQITFANTQQTDVQISAGQDGTVAAYSSHNHVLDRLTPGATGPVGKQLLSKDYTAPQLSVSDGQGVVLFPVAQTVDFSDGGSSDVSQAGASLQLQSWNGTGTSVGLASDRGLYTVVEGKGVQRVKSVAAKGQAIRPVIDARGCIFGAWGEGQGTRIARACPSSGPSAVATMPIDQPAPDVGSNCKATSLHFRGDALSPVLQSNDGCAFVAVGKKFYAIPWKDVLPTQGAQNPQTTARDPKTAPTEIKALPDILYARVGTEAYLPVLANDYDTAGDQLYVKEVNAVSGAPVLLKPAPARDGKSVLLDLRTGASALAGTSLNFTYSVGNGREQNSTAAVTVHIIGLGEVLPSLPTLLQGSESPVLYVAKGSSATYDVLKDWFSADGMPLSIIDASVSSGSSTTVTWSSTGWITVNYDGTALTVVTVTVQGYDGQLGKYPISIKDAEASTSCPVVVDDVVVGAVNGSVTVQPLKNDQDPSGSGLQLGSVTPLSGGPSHVTNGTNGSVTFNPTVSGSFSYTYVAKTGRCDSGTIGYIRLEVDPALAPIAPPLTVDVPSGGAATVDVLTQATDPSGGVLALTSIAWESAPGVAPGDTACSEKSPTCGGVTSLIDHTGQLRLVDSSGGLAKPVGTLTYSISNSSGGSTTGQIFIFRSVPAAGEPPLVCHTMKATVAAGGVVSVPVLQQAWSSYGRPITVSIVTSSPSYPPPATAWTDGSSIRYFAPPNTSAKVIIFYQVATTLLADTPTDCFVEISVTATPSLGSINLQDLDVSVVANGSISIAVPLTNKFDGTPVDPNGSSVSLVGVSSSPQSGKAVLNGTSLTYTAPAQAGQYSFVYQAKSQVGTVGTGTVRVLVLDATTKFAPPVAAPDSYQLTSGSSVKLPVLDNDADPQGRPMSVKLAPSSEGAPLFAKVTSDGLDIGVSVPSSCSGKAADGNCQWQLQYSAVAVGEASALTTVTIKTAPSAGLPPIAHDVFVAYPKNGNSVTLSLAPYVTDPGSGDLAFTLPPFASSTASVDPSGHFKVTLGQDSQAIVYTATDAVTHLEASGVIWVPGLKAQPPTLNTDQGPIKLDVSAGKKSTSVDISNYLTAPPGATLQIKSCVPSDTTYLQVDPCQSPHTTTNLTAADSTPSDRYTLYVTAFASDANGPSNPVTLGIEVDVTGATVINVLLPTLPMTITDTTSQTLDLFRNVSCGNCQRTALEFTPPPNNGAVTVVPSESGSFLALTANTGNKTNTSTVSLPVKVCPPNNSSGCKSFFVEVHLVPPTITITPPTQCPLTVEVNQSGTCDLTSYLKVSSSDPAATAPTLTVGQTIAGLPTGWTSKVSGLSVTITPNAYSQTPVILTYVVSDTYGGTDKITASGSIVVTTQAKPDAPGTPQLGPPPTKSNANQIVVTWTASSANGLPISAYKATATNTSTASDLHTCSSTGATVCTILGLSAGASYVVTVIATNSLGDSPPSAPSQSFQTEDKPAQVQGVNVIPANGQLTVAWSAAASDPQRPVDTYTATASPGGSTCTSSASTCIIPNLANGTQYTVTVTAKNSIDKSVPSTPVTGTPYTVPDAPTGVSATDPGYDGTSTVVSWTAPGNNQGSDISSYAVVASPAGPQCTPDPLPATKATCTGLTVPPATTYTFDVKATNSGGEGTAGTSTQITTSGYSKSTSTPEVSSSAADKAVKWTVSWTAPDTGGATITGYTATATNTASDTLTCSTTAASDGTIPVTCGVSGLTAGSTYVVSVTVALSGKCKQNCIKDLGKTVTYWNPTAPESVMATPVTTPGSGIVVNWSAPAASSGIASYRVTAFSGSTAVGTLCEVHASEQLTCMFPSGSPAPTGGLTTTTPYTFTVQAVPSGTQVPKASASLSTGTSVAVPAP